MSDFKRYHTILVCLFLVGCTAIDINREEEERYPSFGFSQSTDPTEFATVERPELDSDDSTGSSWGRQRRREPATPSELEQRRFQRAYRDKDLILGMDMADVRQIWGEPSEIEVAGESHHGNSRWIYFKGFIGSWSIREARVIYFEEGRVAGWSTR